MDRLVKLVYRQHSIKQTNQTITVYCYIPPVVNVSACVQFVCERERERTYDLRGVGAQKRHPLADFDFSRQHSHAPCLVMSIDVIGLVSYI